MRILSSSGGDVLLLALPQERVRRGDHVVVSDEVHGVEVLLQVYDESYLDPPGLPDDILREEVVRASASGVEHDPLDLNAISYYIKDARLLRCKIRGSIADGKLSLEASQLPSRTASTIRKATVSELSALINLGGEMPFLVGETWESEELSINAESLDGRLTIITGKKESGKSHLAKILVSKLVEFGAHVLIFDLNDEYPGLAYKTGGTPTPIADRIMVLRPGRTLRFTLEYAGRRAMASLLQHALDLPGASIREFLRIWDALEAGGSLSLGSFRAALQGWRCNELVRDALYSRYHALISSGLFTDERHAFRLEEAVRRHPQGGAFIISLARVSPFARRMVVELLLSKLVELLEREAIPPLFLFAEEAHLYLRETHWDDLVTRMRHHGVFTTFITNQPDAIRDGIYRQADNIFLFNFTNDRDLDVIARASTTDADTIKSVVRTLPPRSCLLLGKVTAELPLVVRVASADFTTHGETKCVFTRIKQTAAAQAALFDKR